MPGKNYAGGCGCCCQAALIFHVKVCDSSGLAINGATIEVKDGRGNTVDTGATDSSGAYTTASLVCGTYSWTASLTGWATDSGSATITTNGVNVTVNSYGMTPSTVHLTDAIVSAQTMTSIGGSWQLCYNSNQSGYNFSFDPVLLKCVGTAATVSVRITYALSCNLTTLTQGVSIGMECIDPVTGSGLAGVAPATCNVNPPTCITSNAQAKPTSGTVNALSLAASYASAFTAFPCGLLSPSVSYSNPVGGTVSLTL